MLKRRLKKQEEICQLKAEVINCIVVLAICLYVVVIEFLSQFAANLKENN